MLIPLLNLSSIPTSATGIFYAGGRDALRRPKKLRKTVRRKCTSLEIVDAIH